MKRKCGYCNIEFNFKVKDLRLIDKNLSNYHSYLINCPFCLTAKRIVYNHRPRHLEVL